MRNSFHLIRLIAILTCIIFLPVCGNGKGKEDAVDAVDVPADEVAGEQVEADQVPDEVQMEVEEADQPSEQVPDVSEVETENVPEVTEGGEEVGGE